MNIKITLKILPSFLNDSERKNTLKEAKKVKKSFLILQIIIKNG